MFCNNNCFKISSTRGKKWSIKRYWHGVEQSLSIKPIIQSQDNPKLSGDMQMLGAPHLEYVQKNVQRSHTCSKNTFNWITKQEHCLEINVQLRTPSMFCNNKGTIKTNPMHKRCWQKLCYVFWFPQEGILNTIEVENQRLFYTHGYNLTNEIMCKIPIMEKNCRDIYYFHK